MRRWAFPRSASAPKPAPISIFFLLLLFPSKIRGMDCRERPQRHKTWPRSPAAGPRRREEARQACCPTSTEGSWGVCETKPPIHDPRAT